MGPGSSSAARSQESYESFFLVISLSLILNLPAAVQAVRTSKTNREKLEATNRLAEEFYRTVAIILYSRYRSMASADKLSETGLEIRTLIRDYFENPSFDSWHRLGRLCGDALIRSGDGFAARFTAICRETMRDDQIPQARAGLAQITILRAGKIGTPPRKPDRSMVLDAMRNLRNFRAHEWDNNELLEPLVRTGITAIIVDIVREIFDHLQIKITIPLSLSEHAVDVLEFEGLNANRLEVTRNLESEVVLGVSYIQCLPTENWNENSSNLIKAVGENPRLAVYVKLQDSGRAVGQQLDLSGRIEHVDFGPMGLEELFDLKQGELDSVGALATLGQRFGKITLTGEAVHNVPRPHPGYIPRPKVEAQLFEKLSHRRLYLTTIDGGGGFGKTELAKKVIWDIISGDHPENLPPTLRFKFVVFVTGKTEIFQDGSVQERTPSFRTVEDLIDSILYVAGSHDVIRLPLEEKRVQALSTLNKSSSTLLLLDNLDTVPEKDAIWQYLLELGDRVESGFKVLTTARIRGGSSDQKVVLRRMEDNEARALVESELSRLDLAPSFHREGVVEGLVELTGAIPLLIRQSVRLLSSGYSLQNMRDNLPKDSDKALDFICGLQWRYLDPDSQRLLLSIAYWGGRQNFAEARIVANLNEKAFQSAREKLQESSFLVDETLIDSVLYILPPIAKFAMYRLRERPETEEKFNQATRTIVPGVGVGQELAQFTGVGTDIALNQIFTRADLLVQQGSFAEASDWYKAAVERFPANVAAWREKADFEFRHLNDETKGLQSYETASRLDPRDLATYSEWAYWEYRRGIRHSSKLAFEHVIELHTKLMAHTSDLTLRRVSKVHIAKACLKIAQIVQDETRNPQPEVRRTGLRVEREEFIIKSIHTLEDAIIRDAKTRRDLDYNVEVYDLRASAFLMRGDRRAASDGDYPSEALFNILCGLRVDQWNGGLTSHLNHPFIRQVVEKYHHGPLKGSVTPSIAMSCYEALKADLRR